MIQQRPNYLASTATTQQAVAAVRSHFASLYSLPKEEFRRLIAPAVALGLKSGDFHEPRFYQLERGDVDPYEQY